MATVTLHCLHCQSDAIVRNGHASNGKQLYRCRACGRQSREPSDQSAKPQNKPGARHNNIDDVIPYFACMSMTLGDSTVFKCDASVFAAKIEEMLSALRPERSEIVRLKLRGHDFSFAIDRWSAVNILKDHNLHL